MEQSDGWHVIHIVDGSGKERDVKVYVPSKENDGQTAADVPLRTGPRDGLPEMKGR